MMALLPNYLAGNVLRVLTAMPTASRVTSMKTWNCLGWRIRRGEKGIHIVVPMQRRVEVALDGVVPVFHPEEVGGQGPPIEVDRYCIGHR